MALWPLSFSKQKLIYTVEHHATSATSPFVVPCFPCSRPGRAWKSRAGPFRTSHSSHSYPSPNATGYGGWDVAFAKARRFVAQLSLDEKVSLTTGTGYPP